MSEKHVVKALTGSEIRKGLGIGPDIIESVKKLRGKEKNERPKKNR